MSIKTEKLPEAKYVKLAPYELKLNVDSEFEDFVRSRSLKQEVEPNKRIYIIMLNHKIPFTVKLCDPEKSVISKHTKLKVMNFDTYDHMKLSDSQLNIFMSDDKVRKILSNNISDETMTQACAIALWKDFKKFQSEMLPELAILFTSHEAEAKTDE